MRQSKQTCDMDRVWNKQTKNTGVGFVNKSLYQMETIKWHFVKLLNKMVYAGLEIKQGL